MVKTECFDATGPAVLHILVKTVYFERFGHVCVITPQQNCCLGGNSLKNIVFLKAGLMDHAFLHVFDKLEAQPQQQPQPHKVTATGTWEPQPQRAHRAHL